ncbi:MAG: peroxiredoxin family protein [Ktedonobacteraceae bacterium]
MVSIIALWLLVLVETGLLLLLLRALGQLRQNGIPSVKQGQSSDEWGLAVGEKAPSFVATDYEDKPVRLDDLQGQRRLLAFILPGCSSCSYTIKALHIYAQREDGVTVLVIGGPDRDINHAYALEHDTDIVVLTPSPGFYAELYRIRGVPIAFVIDEVGVIRAKGVVNNHEQLQQLLTEAFALASPL